MSARWLSLLAAHLVILTTPVQAREAVGIYDGSQTEMAASLELKDDGRYVYWVTYGAIDEVSQGTWRETDGGLILTSDPVNAPIFEPLATASGNPGEFAVHLEMPETLPSEAFSALLTMTDGSTFAADFEPGGVMLVTLGGEEHVAKVMLSLPMFEIRSPEFAVAPGHGDLSFRFVPNDLGVLALDNAFLPLRDGAYLLQRFGRTMAFRKLEP